MMTSGMAKCGTIVKPCLLDCLKHPLPKSEFYHWLFENNPYEPKPGNSYHNNNYVINNNNLLNSVQMRTEKATLTNLTCCLHKLLF